MIFWKSRSFGERMAESFSFTHTIGILWFRLFPPVFVRFLCSGYGDG